jgi:hypothetical protein
VALRTASSLILVLDQLFGLLTVYACCGDRFVMAKYFRANTSLNMTPAYTYYFMMVRP